MKCGLTSTIPRKENYMNETCDVLKYTKERKLGTAKSNIINKTATYISVSYLHTFISMLKSAEL